MKKKVVIKERETAPKGEEKEKGNKNNLSRMRK